MRVLISTLYTGKVVKIAVNKLSAEKLVLIVDEPLNKDKKQAIEELQNSIGDIIKIETIKTSIYDISKIAEDVIKKIDEENKNNNEIVIHVSEGRKPTFLAVLFAAYLRKDKIEGIYYITEENNQLLPLPVINLELGETKKQLLTEINKGNKDIKKLKEKLKVNTSMVYSHINNLKKEGYIESNKNNKELKLTDFGRVMIL